MADHTKTVTLTDTQQKILSHFLYNDPGTNAGLDAWVQAAVDGKLESCWDKMRNEWVNKLMNDASFTDDIPSDKDAFVTLVTGRSDYQTRKQRDDAQST